MSRPPRNNFDGAFHHVMARGNDGQNIFHQVEDREDFLRYLGVVCERYGWRIYAYCLMDNHYHLAVHTPHGNLSAGMKDLNSYYTRRVNWRYDTYGHIFQGRFKSFLLGDDAYLLEVIRYISMNPVEAGVVRSPHSWRWSSYKDQVDEKNSRQKPSWLEVKKVWKLTASGSDKGPQSFKSFVLARDKAARASQKKLKELVELTPSEQRALRDARILQDHKSGLTQSEIAHRWKINQSTVQRTLARYNDQ